MLEAQPVLERLALGPLQANCYLYGPPTDGLVIDPGDEPERILRAAAALGMTIRLLVCTHGHFDHTGAVSALAEATGAQMYIHSDDLALMLNGGISAAANSGEGTPPGIPAWLAQPKALPRPPHLLADGDAVTAGTVSLTVIHTPGHTPGSICLYDAQEGILFSGDTLFRMGVGRADLPGGQGRTLLNSIKERLFVLPDITRVYPGHGPSTFIGLEKTRNPFVRPSPA